MPQDLNIVLVIGNMLPLRHARVPGTTRTHGELYPSMFLGDSDFLNLAHPHVEEMIVVECARVRFVWAIRGAAA